MHDLFELSTEVTAVAMIVAGLGNQLDNKQTDTLNPEPMKSALYGVQTYLERIADDLTVLDSKAVEKKGGKAYE